MTTIRDVARAAGASTATVSHVLNGSRFVSAETKTRVEIAIRALAYRPHGVARSLRRSQTGTIGVMISDIANPFFADLVLGVEDVVHRDAGSYNFILCNTLESREKERTYFDVLSQKRVDGLILASAGGNDEAVRDMIAGGLPLVCVDRELEGVKADTIVVDNRAAAQTMVRHLIAVAGIDDLPWTAGLRPRLTVIAQPGRAMGREAARLLLDRIAKRRTDPPVRWVLPTELHVRESCGANGHG